MIRKDAKPEETIQRIEQILAENELSVRIEDQHSFKDMWFSVNISLCGFEGLGSNGKGITRELAYASALSELMERLQTGHLVDRYYNSANILEGTNNLECVKPEWEHYCQRSSGAFDQTRPFWCIENKGISIVNLPYKIINRLCGTNGACAGNTKEEALAQGLCEIAERYALKEIYFNPDRGWPEIDKEAFRELDSYNMLGEIENKGFQLIIKDCTIDDMLPVLAVIAIDKKTMKYGFSMGSDLNADICLQRCITELFQGLDFDFSFRNKLISLFSQKFDKAEEYYKTLVNGNGILPLNFLFDNTLKKQLPGVFQVIDTNEGNLNKMIEIFHSFDSRIYVCDYSFLGYPSYQIYVRGMSEAFITPEENIEDILALESKVKELFWEGNDQLVETFLCDLSTLIRMPRFSPGFNFDAFFGLMLTSEKIPISLKKVLSFVETNNLALLNGNHWYSTLREKRIAKLSCINTNYQLRCFLLPEESVYSEYFAIKTEGIPAKKLFPSCAEGCQVCVFREGCLLKNVQKAFGLVTSKSRRFFHE